MLLPSQSFSRFSDEVAAHSDPGRFLTVAPYLQRRMSLLERRRRCSERPQSLRASLFPEAQRPIGSLAPPMLHGRPERFDALKSPVLKATTSPNFSATAATLAQAAPPLCSATRSHYSAMLSLTLLSGDFATRCDEVAAIQATRSRTIQRPCRSALVWTCVSRADR